MAQKSASTTVILIQNILNDEEMEHLSVLDLRNIVVHVAQAIEDAEELTVEDESELKKYIL